MASSGRPRSTGSSSRGNSKKSSSGKTTRSNASRRTTRSTPVRTESGFPEFFKKFAASKAAMPVIFLAAVILIVGIDLLVSWNSYGLFFKILGVEILIAVIVWVILTLVFSRKSSKDPDASLEDEV